MDDPAEIEKWIASRKRNFPTRANIQRKQEYSTAIEESGGFEISRFEVIMRQRIELVRR